MTTTLITNVAGIVRTTTAFLPLLRDSAAPAIVNVTSGLGSFSAVHDESRVESAVVALALQGADGPTGTFTDRAGTAPF